MSGVRTDMVAVVGMAGRFPGAPDLDAFWQLLISGGDAVGPVPPERWDAAEVLDPAREIQAVGGFLDRVDRFDAEFFGISPREAEVLDPQQRLMLETVWHALEDADEVAAGLRGSRTGMYAGGLWHDYELLRKDSGAPPTPHSIVGGSLDIISSRVSYALGLTGPSLTVQSSCSSSLVALHLACRALRGGEVEAALVGGSNLMLTPEVTVGLTHFGGLSPTGRCHAFGAGADGFVRGEGVAAVYLKTLERALRDGDRVRAVVVASEVNNDGGGDSLVTPDPAAQRDLLRRVYGPGGPPPGKLAYVEAHGTGTARGDTAEAGALGEVLGAARAGRPLHIGSVKTNIGHLEPAAGLAGLIKAVLALEHGVVPPSLHARELNPAIDFDALNLAVAREPLPLEADGHIGVNSFGWGGTNAHAVLARAPASGAGDAEGAEADADGRPFLLPLSAHTPQALAQREREVRVRLAEDAAAAPELARALAWRRDHFPERRALLGPELTEAAAGRAREAGKVAFVFPGQGAQWAGMGAGLYGYDAAFTRAMDRCARALSRHVPWDVRELVTGDAAPSRVDQVQPALWAMSVSLAAAWTEAGVRPDAVVGHSQGEIAAATVAGRLSLEDGALVVSRRSDILRRAAGQGRMLAVDLGPDEVRRALAGFEGLVELAVHNGARSCVLSGDADSVLLLQEILEAEEVFCRLVEVDYGSHSPQIDPLVPAIQEALAPVRPRAGHTPMLSTVRLSWLDGPEPASGYWAENLRSPVRFAEAVELLLDDGVTHLVEVSPHPGLGAALRQTGDERAEPPVVLGTLRRGEGSRADLLTAFGEAYVSGLGALGPHPARGRSPAAVPPPYPFQRERHWVVPRRHAGARTGRLTLPLKPATANGLWEGAVELTTAAHPWLADHRVAGAAVFPAGGYLALTQSALARHAQHAQHGPAEVPAALRDVALPALLALGEDPVRLALTWRPGAGAAGVATLASAGETGWTRHCRALASFDPAEPAGAFRFPERLLAGRPLDPEEFYRSCAARGLDYGPAFRSVTGGHAAEDEALVSVELPAGSPSGELAGALHPVLWDGVLQAALAAGEGPAAVPVSLRSATVTAAAAGARRLWVHARRTDGGPAAFDLTLFADDRTPVGRVEGVALAELPGGTAEDELTRHAYRMTFTPKEREPGEPGTVVVVGAPPDALPGAGETLRPDADTVVFVAPEDEDEDEDGDEDGEGREGLARLTDLVRRCLDECTGARLAVVTRESAPGAGPYAGFVAVVQAEHPQLRARLIETGAPLSGMRDEVWAELGARDGEDRVVLRGGERLVGRRVAGGAPQLPPPWRTGGPAGDFRQDVARPGSLDSLCRRARDEAEPGPGQVEVAVEAASLNFVDVMKAMGVYPDATAESEPLGLDCAGTVTRVGPGVSAPAAGDRVVACGFGALASRVTVDARHVVPLPAALTPAEAAALPMVAVTAWHALVRVARIEPGETVLVHSAAGGLGLAALRIARLSGATVLATAGTEDKRAYLRELGVRDVFDSRGLDWAAGVREATGGRGVDVVLNSLAGAAIPLGMEALAEDGRFVEVGKRDIHEGTAVELDAFRGAAAFAAVDIAGLLRRRPERFASALAAVWKLVETGEFAPLPVRELPFAEAEEAFRALSRGAHVGKLVLTDPGGCGPPAPQPLPRGRFRAGGSYLITGGLGALGMSLAEYLADSGAGALVLLGRSEPDAAARARIDALRGRGVKVRVRSADVADEPRMRTVLDELRQELPPLRGVFHAAGVLDDATLRHLEGERLARVLRPKAAGARVLHALTADDGLDLFVLFSSAAAFVGTAGQAAYAAANSALDALALERRRAGLPGLSVQWGPVSGTGLAARDANRGERLADRGMGGVTAADCWRALRRFLETDEDVVAFAALDPRRWVETYPATAALPSWQCLAGDGDGDGAGEGHAARSPAERQGELRRVPAERRRDLVAEVVRRDAARVLRTAPERLAHDVPLKSLGLDSLMSLELRNKLEVSLGLRLSPTLLWQHGSLARLSTALSELLGPA